MEIIRVPLSGAENGVAVIPLSVDRQTLAKRRWRGVAGDGREFGFDLEHALHDGEAFFRGDAGIYVVSQQPEEVFEVPLGTPAESARLAWMIGNLHFSLQVAGDVIRVPADEALRQMFVREKVAFTESRNVFHSFHHAHVH